MIEVISAVTSNQAKTGSEAETSEAKIELLAAAADFFADRLLTHKQQKHLSFFSLNSPLSRCAGQSALTCLLVKQACLGFVHPAGSR